MRGEVPLRRVPLVVLAVLVVLGVGAFGVLGSPGGPITIGSAEGYSPAAQKVVIVAVPRLTWEDVETAVTDTCAGSDEPVCIWADELANVGATNSLRAIGPLTSLPEGYLTLGAGNRATMPSTAPRTVTQGVDGSLQADAITAAVADADRKLYGAEPGALGQALHDAGATTAVVTDGPEAVLALMDESGEVDGGVLGMPDDATAAETALNQLRSHDVVLVEMSGLDHVEEGDPLEPDRKAAVLAALQGAYRVIAGAPTDTLAILLTPAPPRDKGQLGVFALQGATTAPSDPAQGRPPGSVFVSPTTRRPAYVTLTDVAPTVLARLGIDRPDSMSGTPIVSTDRTATVGDLADIDRVSRYRDAVVGPVSVVFVVLQVIGAVVAMVAIRRRSRPNGPTARAALVMACMVIVVPPLAFLSGLVPYDRLAQPVYVAALFVAAAGVALVMVALTERKAWALWVPALLLIVAALGVQWGDIVTGGRLQINTPFGYSPIVAGRFQGFGNLSFAMASSAAVIVASAVYLLWPRADRFAAAVWATAIGAVMVLCDGLPAYGADVGGVLALIPAFVVLVLVLTGRRVSVVKLLAAGAAAVVVLAAVTVFDMSRPEERRTHLGRFADKLLDGDGGLILRRKVHANIAILTSSVWAWLVPVAVLFFVVIAARRGGAISRLSKGVPGAKAFLLASLVLAVVGFAVNDSGVAIPAAMAGLVLPWVTALALEARMEAEPAANAPPAGASPADEAVP